jgi:hypothetical protein
MSFQDQHSSQPSQAIVITAHNQANDVPPLLKLPRELRDMIYVHVLKTDSTIKVIPYIKEGHTHHCMFTCDTPNDRRVELNQMKFVCKQLYSETSSLPPTCCPKLIFPLRTDTTESASIICGRYLASLGADDANNVRNIEVHERIPNAGRFPADDKFDSLGVSQLVTFAATHPYASIEVRLDSADPQKTPHAIWYVASSCHLMARKTKDPFCNFVCPSQLRFLEHLAEIWPGYALDALPFPVNISFRPGCEVDEISWKKCVESYGGSAIPADLGGTVWDWFARLDI